MFTKLLISLVMAALTSLALGYLAHQSLSIPTTNEAWGQFAILFLGILTAVLLVAQTQPSASHGSVEEDDEMMMTMTTSLMKTLKKALLSGLTPRKAMALSRGTRATTFSSISAT